MRDGRRHTSINATDWLEKSLKILYSMLVKDIALRGWRQLEKVVPVATKPLDPFLK